MKHKINSATAHQAASSSSNATARAGSAFSRSAFASPHQQNSKQQLQNGQQQLKQLQQQQRFPAPPPPPNIVFSQNAQQTSLQSNPPRYLTSRKPLYFDPDDGFYSGAWMFDLAQAPVWLQKELTAPSTRARPTSTAPRSAHVTPSKRDTSPAQNIRDFFDFRSHPSNPPLARPHASDPGRPVTIPVHRVPSANSTPTKFSTSQQSSQSRSPSAKATERASKPSYMTIKERPFSTDEYFYSGAWLFDETCVPEWMRASLGSNLKSRSSASTYDSSSSINNVQRVYSRAAAQSSAASRAAAAQPPRVASRSAYQTIDLRPDNPVEEAIESGAWLFDLARAPKWFQDEVRRPLQKLPTRFPAAWAMLPHEKSAQSTRTASCSSKPQAKCVSSTECTSEELLESGAWLFDKEAERRVMKSPRSNAARDVAVAPKNGGWQAVRDMRASSARAPVVRDLTSQEKLESGAWLFDASEAPSCLREVLRSENSSNWRSQSSNRPASASPHSRQQPQSNSMNSQRNIMQRNAMSQQQQQSSSMNAPRHNATQNRNLSQQSNSINAQSHQQQQQFNAMNAQRHAVQRNNISQQQQYNSMTIQRNVAQRHAMQSHTMSHPQPQQQQQIRIMPNPLNNMPYKLQANSKPTAFDVMQSWEEISPIEMQHQAHSDHCSPKAHDKPRSRGSRTRPSKSHY